MSAVGSLVFCTDCGNLLDSSTGNMNHVLVCDCCGADNQDAASKTSTTKSNPANFPSVLRQQRSVIQKVERSDMKNTTYAQETCSECGRREVRFTSAQLRGADEGSTIFYACECGHKWNTNN
ncbi:hypothetical protein BJ875DRAFT_507166 [Amylocarpus encephaloides]|uniref:DNA-directed RNA polymerase subunit n=1 Tax=Amylocarpus encephaloides TaxID=45428 RepID=A0A9P8C284_9HELO|nr:hypothetical protein BJ875DRAFT_507166 [Amylocarpus encephaloides]